MTSLELVGTTAIVTGASKGIGYAIADLLMAHGADVAITSRHDEELKGAADALTAAHPDRRALPVVADVGQADDIDTLFAATAAELGSAAIVVNNAGNSTLDLIENLPEHDWDSVLTTHLKGTYLASKAAIRQMRTAGLHGSIINLGSVETFATTRGNAHYSAAKAGIDKFTEVAALEAGRHGIRVNAVAPGATATPLSRSASTPDFDAAWERSFVVKRWGDPLDIAQAVVFLSSNYASWITGITLLVDGGSHLRGLPDYADYLIPESP